MKPSHQVSYDMRLPPNKKIPVKNDQYIQGTPWLVTHGDFFPHSWQIMGKNPILFFYPSFNSSMTIFMFIQLVLRKIQAKFNLSQLSDNNTDKYVKEQDF